MKLDKFDNPYLIWTYTELTPEEKLKYFENVGKKLLGHKYRYYLGNEGIISDGEYDYVERYYEAVAEDLGLEPEIVNMVGFNSEHKWATEIVEQLKEKYNV